MTERSWQRNDDPASVPVPRRDAPPPIGWHMGWTKHGTVCMTRGIRILNRPVASAEAFEQYGTGQRAPR